MKLHFRLWNAFTERFSPAIELEIGSWWFSFYFDPRVWGWKYHRNRWCYKFWLLIGFFEISQAYREDEIESEE